MNSKLCCAYLTNLCVRADKFIAVSSDRYDSFNKWGRNRSQTHWPGV